MGPARVALTLVKRWFFESTGATNCPAGFITRLRHQWLEFLGGEIRPEKRGLFSESEKRDALMGRFQKSDQFQAQPIWEMSVKAVEYAPLPHPVSKLIR